MKRLRIAKSVGWLAEFPLELWGLILRHALGRNCDSMDVALALRMAAVSHGLRALVLPHCRTLLCTIVVRARPAEYPDTGERLSEQVQRFLGALESASVDGPVRQARPSHAHLRRYLTLCATQYRESAEHLINALSLVHFVKQEREARLDGLLTRRVPRADDDSFVAKIVHFDGKRARLLRRMPEVWVCCASVDDLVQRARLLCCENEELHDQSALMMEQDPVRSLTLAMRVLERHNALCLRKPDGYSQLGHVVLKRDVLGGARYDHIQSVEARDFRRACYDGLGYAIARVTLACRLSAHHTRNWLQILESDRFKAFTEATGQ